MATEIWQQCPICNGTGLMPASFYGGLLTAPPVICKTCKGQTVISLVTGLPPTPPKA